MYAPDMYVCTKGDNKLLQCLHSRKDTNLSCRKVLHEAKIITKKTYDYWMQLSSALTMNVASLHTVTENCHTYSYYLYLSYCLDNNWIWYKQWTSLIYPNTRIQVIVYASRYPTSTWDTQQASISCLWSKIIDLAW